MKNPKIMVSLYGIRLNDMDAYHGSDLTVRTRTSVTRSGHESDWVTLRLFI